MEWWSDGVVEWWITNDERNWKKSNDLWALDCGCGSVALVGNWQGLARQTARRHSIHQRQFQFLFSHRHLHTGESDFDVHSLVLPQVTLELSGKWQKMDSERD